MPRQGPRKTALTIRLTAQSLGRLDAWASRTGITRTDDEPNRSEAIERLIRDGLPNLEKPVDLPTRVIYADEVKPGVTLIENCTGRNCGIDATTHPGDIHCLTVRRVRFADRSLMSETPLGTALGAGRGTVHAIVSDEDSTEQPWVRKADETVRIAVDITSEAPADTP